MVVPKRDHASKKRPELDKNGPIMMRDSMASSDGLCMNDDMRRACIDAATRILISVYSCGTGILTINVASLCLCINRLGGPLST